MCVDMSMAREEAHDICIQFDIASRFNAQTVLSVTANFVLVNVSDYGNTSLFFCQNQKYFLHYSEGYADT